jgi:hypothetical protein
VRALALIILAAAVLAGCGQGPDSRRSGSHPVVTDPISIDPRVVISVCEKRSRQDPAKPPNRAFAACLERAGVPSDLIEQIGRATGPGSPPLTTPRPKRPRQP